MPSWVSLFSFLFSFRAAPHAVSACGLLGLLPGATTHSTLRVPHPSRAFCAKGGRLPSNPPSLFSCVSSCLAFVDTAFRGGPPPQMLRILASNLATPSSVCRAYAPTPQSFCFRVSFFFLLQGPPSKLVLCVRDEVAGRFANPVTWLHSVAPASCPFFGCSRISIFCFRISPRSSVVIPTVAPAHFSRRAVEGSQQYLPQRKSSEQSPPPSSARTSLLLNSPR